MTGTLDKSSRSAEATEALGVAFAPALAIGDVVALRGDLGAGKTRFAAGVAAGLGVEGRVRSPSFTLVHEHAGRIPLAHLDLYRLAGVPEAEGLGLEDLAGRATLVVEWGERLPSSWLHEALMITVTPGVGDTRLFHASAWAGRGRELLEAWRALPDAW